MRRHIKNQTQLKFSFAVQEIKNMSTEDNV